MERLGISKKVLAMPKKELLKWIDDRMKKEKSQDWKEELSKLKESLNVPRTGAKSKKDKR